MTARNRMLAMFTAIGGAHAGEPLTPETLMRLLLPANDSPEEIRRAADFRRRFNGPPPPLVTFPDEETAALAVAFENTRKGGAR